MERCGRCLEMHTKYQINMIFNFHGNGLREWVAEWIAFPITPKRSGNWLNWVRALAMQKYSFRASSRPAHRHNRHTNTAIHRRAHRLAITHFQIHRETFWSLLINSFIVSITWDSLHMHGTRYENIYIYGIWYHKNDRNGSSVWHTMWQAYTQTPSQNMWNEFILIHKMQRTYWRWMCHFVCVNGNDECQQTHTLASASISFSVSSSSCRSLSSMHTVCCCD